MKIVNVSATPMSSPVPEEHRHRTDLGTKVKSDATLIRVETDNGGVYEAHITKADGTTVTVGVDKSFSVTGEE